MNLTNVTENGTTDAEDSTYRGLCTTPASHALAMITLNIVAALLGTTGNLLVCGSVLTTYSLRTIPNLILVSLAIADLLISVLAQPLLVAYLAVCPRETRGDIVELLFRLLGNACCGASVLHLCVISVERCIVVLKPLSFRNILTKRRIVVAVALAWILPVINAILRLTISKRFTSYFAVVILALSIVTIIVCYTVIITTVRKQRRANTARNGNRKLRDEVEWRVTVTVAIVIVLFIVSWFPMIVLRALRATDNQGLAYNWARTLALTNSAMNPWIYCLRLRDFRAAYKRLFIKCHWKA